MEPADTAARPPGHGDLRLDRLLDDAAEAIERSDWAAALAMAETIQQADPGNEEAAAIRTLAQLRARRSARAGTGTRRQITVLFADMVGSTRLAATLDPEEMRDVLLGFQRACSAVVEEFDGHVAQFIGDGVLVYFGHPRAHEDDAARAVLAGHQLIDAVQGLGLSVRVGVHTGLAVIADMGSGTHTLANDVVGETPNLAARIHAAAPPDTVVMSRETYDLVRDLIEGRELPAPPLKDIDRPVQLFESLGERATESRFEAAGRHRAALVGRARERDAIAAAWDRATAAAETIRDGTVSRHPAMALALVGEPGIGKSRLVAYAKEHAAAHGGVHRTLQCSPYHGSSPLYPLATAMRREGPVASLGAHLETDTPADLFVLARLTGTAPPEGVDRPDLSPDELRDRSFALALDWVGRLSRPGPLLLAVEDLQWADPSTLELLRRLLETPIPGGVLILVTSRDRATVEGLAPVALVSVPPLSAAECRRLVDQIASPELEHAARHLIVEHSSGVPLFAEELTRMFGSASTEVGAADFAIPPTLADLLVARVDQFLGEHRLAQVIATVGQPVGAPLLTRLVGVEPAELERQLATLIDGGLLEVTADADGRPLYQFRHALQRDAAYQLQLRSTRRATHTQVALALSEDDGGAGAPSEVLAYHHERAGDLGAAARHWYLAGLRHAGAAAYTEAIQHYRRAADAAAQATPPLPASFEVDVQAGLAESLLAIRGYTSDEVASAYGRLRDLSTGPGAVASHRQNLRGLYGMWAYYHVRGDNRTSATLAQRLLEVAAAARDPDDLLAAQAIAGYQLLWGGRFAEAAEHLAAARTRRARPAERGPFPHDPGVGATVNLATALWALGRFAEAEAALAEAAARAEALSGPGAEFTRAYTFCFASAQRYLAGDLEKCVEAANRSIAVSSAHGFLSWLGASSLMVTLASALSTDPEPYIHGVRYGLEAWRNAGAETNRTLFLLGLAQAHGKAGQAREGLAALDEALIQAEATDEVYLVSPIHCTRAELLALVDPAERAPAVDAARTALETARRQGARAFALAALTRLCRLGDADSRPALAALAGELGRDETGRAEPVVAATRAVLTEAHR